MRVRIVVPVVFAVACSPAEPELPERLEAAFAEAGPDEPIGLLSISRDGRHPGGHRRLRHVPVGLGSATRAEVVRLLRDDPALILVPDGPLAGAKTEDGLALTDDPDVVRRTVGADLVGPSGAGVVVAIVDSGVDERHKDLPNDLLVGAADFVGDDPDAEDGYGHGTMVAGVLAGTREGVEGIAPAIRLVSARVLDDAGEGSVSAAVAATDWILEHAAETGVDIVHYSVGAAPGSSFTADPLALAAEAALEAGLVVVAAAGNYGSSDGAEAWGGIVSPAVHPGVITVGATDGRGTAVRSDDAVAAWSSRGPTPFDGHGKPDLVAPGTALALLAAEDGAIFTAFPETHVASWEGVKSKPSAPYAVASGTSFAAPVVTGVVALLLEVAPELSATGAKAALEITAGDVGDATWLRGGAGQVNAIGAVRLASYWQARRDGRSAVRPVPSDTIEGETISWGRRLLWDGYVFDDAVDLAWLGEDGSLAVGDLDGTGILWEGYGARVRYLGVIASGDALLDADVLAWTDALWGTGILWDGTTLAYASGRVWTEPTTWSGSFVQPGALATAGLALPLFDDPAFTGLTALVDGAPDPLPVRPLFE